LLAASSAATLGAVAFGGGSRLGRNQRRLSIVALGAGALLGTAAWQFERLRTEKARYTVERRVGAFEVRRYPAQVVAETKVEGLPVDEALSEGFQRLAGYIFGGNRGRRARPESIPMTAPVTAERAQGEAMAMTAPAVLMGGDLGGTVVRFGMPRGRTLADLPEPEDRRVVLKEIPSRRIAAFRYHGRYRGPTKEAKARELLEAVERLQLVPRGPVGFAGYDPPWTLPLLRRVEAWVEIA
jgi:hypothetical protein